MPERLVTIYGLVDPRDAELRYVGKTVALKERMYRHSYEERRGCRLPLRQWLRTLRYAKLAPVLIILDEVSSLDANTTECNWISCMADLGCDLLNRTPGGDGQPLGYEASQEARAKLSRTKKGRPHTAEHRARIAAALGTPELRERKRQLMRARWVADHPHIQAFRAGRRPTRSEEHRQKIKNWWTPERRAERAAKMTGRKMPAESVEKARRARTGKPCLAGRKPHNVSPEGRRVLREKMLGNKLGARQCSPRA